MDRATRYLPARGNGLGPIRKLDLRLSVEQLAHLRKDITKHLRCEHACIRVVARAVIAVEQRQRADGVRAAVAEWKRRPLDAARQHETVMRDAPEREDGAELGH